MRNVFVLDTNKRPLNPVHAGRARILLSSGKAAILKRYPFTIILKTAVEAPTVEALRLKIDPGSTKSGLAIVNDASGEVIFAAELSHRGAKIKQRLDARRAVRRARRQRTTRYRKPRFDNRKRREGWLPPSLASRISHIETWVKRLARLCPIAALSQEVVRFDTQLMENPEISGVAYQQGTLQGYEVREYLLEKWRRACAYCGATQIPLQVEHIQCRAKASLKDAAAVNTTRWALYRRLHTLGLPIECGTGGRTKFNRVVRGLEKTHWLDAACVGASTPEHLQLTGVVPLLITANGHGSRQMCRMDRFGFPRTRAKQAKRVKGFQTGDIVKAVVTSGTKTGTYIGRVAVRSSGSFNMVTPRGTVQGISHRYCIVEHHVDGYSYQRGAVAFPPVA